MFLPFVACQIQFIFYSLAVTLIKVCVKPVEQNVTPPIVLPSLSYKEQSLIHITLALIYDTTMVVPRNKKKQFEIVRS